MEEDRFGHSSGGGGGGIRCQRCRGSRFTSQGGFFMCLDCGTRNDEHGAVTELDDSSFHATEGSMTLKTK